MDFKQTQQAYIHLKDQLEKGRVTAEEFEARVNEMTVTDSAGVLWQIGVKTGKWYRYDGQGWMEDVPRVILSDGQSYPAQPAFATGPVFPPTQASPQYAEQPKRRNWIGGGLIAGALGLCCLIMVVVVLIAWNYDPSPAPPLVATLPRPATPSVPAVGPSTVSPEPLAGPGFDPGLVQFEDDFSNPNSGWDDIRVGEDFNTLYFEDGYLFVITSVDFYASANPHLDFPADVQVEVDARKISGSQNDEYGLLCRYVENSDGTSSYYYFAITIYGAGLVYKVDHDQALIITSPQTAEMSGIVLPGNQVNRIRADCVGDTLTLYVNGQSLNTAVDSSFTGGDVGLRVDSETGETEIRFDNFIVFKPGY